MDLMDKILELAQQGYHCSQIMTILMLESIGEENPDLVKAMGGLGGGVGFSGNCCGCMTGGVCILSYFTGKREPDSYEHGEHKTATGEFAQWFTETMTAEYGSERCRDILKGDRSNMMRYCPQILADSFIKCMEILTERGFI